MMKKKSISLVLTLALLGAACFPAALPVAAEGDFVPVTDIVFAPGEAQAGTPLALDSAAVVPADATNAALVWRVKDAGATGAAIEGGALLARYAGQAVLTATAPGGAGGGDFAKDFPLTVTGPAFVPVAGIEGVPTAAVAGVPLALDSAAVVPQDATNAEIVWSVKDAGGTGAVAEDGQLTTASAGTVVLAAAIAGGAGPDTPYIQSFTVQVAPGAPGETDETEKPDAPEKVVTAFEELGWDVQFQFVEQGAKRQQLNLPNTLSATVDGVPDTVIEGVRWACETYSEETGMQAEAGEYLWTAVLPAGYRLQAPPPAAAAEPDPEAEGAGTETEETDTEAETEAETETSGTDAKAETETETEDTGTKTVAGETQAETEEAEAGTEATEAETEGGEAPVPPVIYVLVEGGGQAGITANSTVNLSDVVDDVENPTTANIQAALQDAMDAALAEAESGETVTVTGEYRMARSRTLAVDIRAGVTVRWQAVYHSDSTFKTSFPLVTYTGEGTFLVADGGYLWHRGAGTALRALGSRVVVGAASGNAFVIATSGSAIEGLGTDTSATDVEINANGYLMNWASSNVHPVLDMSNPVSPYHGKVTINGGGVGAEDTDNRNYAIQTYGDIEMNSGEVGSYALNGRAINLVGRDSAITVTGGEIYADGANGVAISTATTVIDGTDAHEAVANSKVFIRGGTVRAASYAIRTTGDHSVVDISGGSVISTGDDAVHCEGEAPEVLVSGNSTVATEADAPTATPANQPDAIDTSGPQVGVSGNSKVTAKSGNAIRAEDAQVAVSGNSFVFAYSQGGGDYINGARNVITAQGAAAGLSIGDDAVVAGWDPLQTLYAEGSPTDLYAMNSSGATPPTLEWAYDANHRPSLHYVQGGNSGNHPLPVRLYSSNHYDHGLIYVGDGSAAGVGQPTGNSQPTVAKGQLWIDMNDNHLLDGIDMPLTEQAGHWSYDSGTDTLHLNGFQWVTRANTALTILGNATVELGGGTENWFYTNFRDENDAADHHGIYVPNADSTVTVQGTDTDGTGILVAFAMGVPGSPAVTPAPGNAWYGVYAPGSDIVIESGTLSGTGLAAPQSAGPAIGVRCDGLELNGGTVEGLGVNTTQANRPGDSAIIVDDDAALDLGSAYTWWASADPAVLGQGAAGLGQGSVYADSQPAPYNAVYANRPGNLYARITADPMALVADATVDGTVDEELNEAENDTWNVHVTLYGDVQTSSTLPAQGDPGVDASDWFANLPYGLSVTATQGAAPDVIQFIFTGTPLEASHEDFVLFIPVETRGGVDVLAGGGLARVSGSLPVRLNPNAQFSIAGLLAPPAPPAAQGPAGVYAPAAPLPAVAAPAASPQTGDDSRMPLWLLLAALSAAGLGGVHLWQKRQRQQG